MNLKPCQGEHILDIMGPCLIMLLNCSRNSMDLFRLEDLKQSQKMRKVEDVMGKQSFLEAASTKVITKPQREYDIQTYSQQQRN